MITRTAPLLVTLALFLALLGAPAAFAPAFAVVNPQGMTAIYDRDSFLTLTAWHVGAVVLSTGLAFLIAAGGAIFVTRQAGQDFRPLARALGTIGQTVPPVAVLAVTVPLVGFGFTPTVIALFVYALLPIFENTMAGLASVPGEVRTAALGMGMTPGRMLWSVELPLALPIILAGLRISAIISIGTATIGSTVGAKGLGEVIIAGLQAGNTAFVLQGAVLVALLAVLFNFLLAAAERRARRWRA